MSKDSNGAKASEIDLPESGQDPEQAKSLEEIPERERLGVLVRRYRIAAGMTIPALASCLDLTPTVISEVEGHMLALPAAVLQRLAQQLNVRYKPILDAARDWHRSVWRDKTDKPGVQLAEITGQTRTLNNDSAAVEAELIAVSDELVFIANVARELSVRAEQTAIRARELLSVRGVSVPLDDRMDGPELVTCDGPYHEEAPRQLRRGRDYVLVSKPNEPGDDRHYFCSRRCADAWDRSNDDVG